MPLVGCPRPIFSANFTNSIWFSLFPCRPKFCWLECKHRVADISDRLKWSGTNRLVRFNFTEVLKISVIVRDRWPTYVIQILSVGDNFSSVPRGLQSSWLILLGFLSPPPPPPHKQKRHLGFFWYNGNTWGDGRPVKSRKVWVLWPYKNIKSSQQEYGFHATLYKTLSEIPSRVSSANVAL